MAVEVGESIPNRLLLGAGVNEADGRAVCDGVELSISIRLGFVGATGAEVGATWKSAKSSSSKKPLSLTNNKRKDTTHHR